MAQWKLTPREPTPEMIDAATGSINDGMPDEDYNDDARSYLIAAWDAAPSPAGDEDEVERVGAVIEATAHIIAEGGEDDGIANIEEVARAALSAMRPAPKLTEAG